MEERDFGARMADVGTSCPICSCGDICTLFIKFCRCSDAWGGPRATTIELAIYQTVRFEFDFATAAMLGLVQLGLSVIAALLALCLGKRDGFGFGFLIAHYAAAFASLI